MLNFLIPSIFLKLSSSFSLTLFSIFGLPIVLNVLRLNIFIIAFIFLTIIFIFILLYTLLLNSVFSFPRVLFSEFKYFSFHLLNYFHLYCFKHKILTSSLFYIKWFLYLYRMFLLRLFFFSTKTQQKAPNEFNALSSNWINGSCVYLHSMISACTKFFHEGEYFQAISCCRCLLSYMCFFDIHTIKLIYTASVLSRP